MFGIDVENFNYRLFLRTRKYLVYAVLSVVLTLVLLLALLWPQIQRIFSLYKQLQSENKAIVLLRQKAQALEAIEANPIYQNQNKIHRVLPSRKAVFELLASLKYAADISSVTVTKIDLNPGLLATDSAQAAQPSRVAPTARKIPGVEKLLIQITVEGNKSSINLFTSQLNNIVPLTSITKMSLQAMKGNALDFGTTDFEAEIELTTYYFNNTIVVSASSPLPKVTDKEQKALSALSNFFDPQFTRPSNITGGGVEDLFGEDVLKLGE